MTKAQWKGVTHAQTHQVALENTSIFSSNGRVWHAHSRDRRERRGCASSTAQTNPNCLALSCDHPPSTKRNASVITACHIGPIQERPTPSACCATREENHCCPCLISAAVSRVWVSSRVHGDFDSSGGLPSALPTCCL